MTQHAKNRAEAVQLLEFMVSEEAQAYYAEINHEYPVVETVAPVVHDCIIGQIQIRCLEFEHLGGQ